MRHYEIVFLVDPNQREKISTILGKHRSIVNEGGGKFHRLEEWGRRSLAYPIANNKYAFYVLMNIECSFQVLAEIEKYFRFSDLILRSLIIKKDKAETKESFVLMEQRKQKENKDKEKRKRAPVTPTQEVAEETGFVETTDETTPETIDKKEKTNTETETKENADL